MQPKQTSQSFAKPCDFCNFCTNQLPPQHRGAVSDPIWVGSKRLLAFPRVPVTQGILSIQTIFSPCYPLNDCRRALRSLFEIGRLFSLSFAHLLILLLLLMSGNIHSNLGPSFPVQCVLEGVQTFHHLTFIHPTVNHGHLITRRLIT